MSIKIELYDHDNVCISGILRENGEIEIHDEDGNGFIGKLRLLDFRVFSTE